MNTSRLQRKIHIPKGLLWAVGFAAMSLAGATPTVIAQTTLGGHIGFVLPLVTRIGGQTTTLGDSFSIGFPVGLTAKGSGRMAFDLAFLRNFGTLGERLQLERRP